MSKTVKNIVCDEDRATCYRTVAINDIFRFERGHIISKKDIMENEGVYPVYSTQKCIYGYIDSYMKDGNYLLWNTDGLAGYIKRVGGKFSYTNIVGIMVPTNKIDMGSISLDYLKFYLEPIFRKNRKGRMGINGKNEYTKLNSTMIKRLNIQVPIPIRQDGSFNIERQQELAQRYQNVEAMKHTLLSKIDTLAKTKIVIDKDETTRYKEVYITELFTPKNGSSTYTKEWCQSHDGNIPLFSGNTTGIFDHINVADYDGEYITWAKDGLAGYMMHHTGRFSLTGHRGILIPTKKCINIDLQYMKWVIEPIFRANIKGRMGHNGENEYTTLNSEMIKAIKEKIRVPIKTDGTFDLEKQQELAQKYAAIETIKENVYKQICELTNIVVS